MAPLDDTIVAAATATGPGERAVVRLSGADALALAARVFAPADGEPLAGRPLRRRVAGAVRLAGIGPVEASAWLFGAPRSYTGEDLVELHAPAWPALTAAITEALLAAGARAAGPGELTRRAVLNARIDLTQAEAVGALIGAAGEQEARAALRQVGGGLRRPVEAAIAELLELAAHLEAGIDFSEEDCPLLPPEELATRMVAARAAVEQILGAAAPLRVHGGAEPRVVLAGPANAGKSSLFNRLVGEEAALVDARAGTTRDAVGAEVALPGGARCRLIDPAGEKPPADPVERAALEDARAQRAAADLIVLVADASDRSSLARAAALRAELPRGVGCVVALNKSDRDDRGARLADSWDAFARAPLVATSARTGSGVPALRAMIEALLAVREGAEAAAADYLLNARHARCLSDATVALDEAAGALGREGEDRWELAAIDLRRALDHLGEVTGAVLTEDVLDRVFATFCVGK